MTPVGGGVQMNPTEALQVSHLLKDEEGKVKDARQQVQARRPGQGPVVVGLTDFPA